MVTPGCTVDRLGVDLEITNEKIRLLLSMLLLTGYRMLPDHKTYWEATTDTFMEARSNSMPRNTFECILQNLHLCDNEQHNK